MDNFIVITHPLRSLLDFFFFVGTIVPWQLRRSLFHHNGLDQHKSYCFVKLFMTYGRIGSFVEDVCLVLC